MVKVSLATVVLLLGLSSCHGLNVPRQPPGRGQPSFMETWRLYNHCFASDDLEVLTVDTFLLKQATARMEEERLIPVFSPLQRFVSPSPVRLAADPRAMTAACTLRAAETARSEGWNTLALTLYESVMKDFPESPYEYYRKQASAGVSQVSRLMAQLSVLPPLSSSTTTQGSHRQGEVVSTW